MVVEEDAKRKEVALRTILIYVKQAQEDSRR
jgi:hypothetical protein